MRLPEVGKISTLIDAVRDYAVSRARASYDKNPAEAYRAPCLASWDAFLWFELVQDWEMVDFLLSGGPRSRRLMRSLQSLLQWYGQTELDGIPSGTDVLSGRN